MNNVDRRIFVKTLLATAAGSSPACAAIQNVSPRFFSLDEGDAAGFCDIESENQRLRISGTGAPLTYQNFLRIGDDWKPATLAGVPLISGGSFPLVSSRIDRQGTQVRCKGEAEAHSLDGKPLKYAWNAEISMFGGDRLDPWIKFRTTLHLPAPMRLRDSSAPEPQIIAWLSSSSTLMEGQSGSWRRVLLSQPTRNSLGAAGNDLPAVYLLDQTMGIESMMFFDMDDMGWMSSENLPRFLVYRCSSIAQIKNDGTQRLGIGLLADQATGTVLPAGDIDFTCWLLQRPMTRLVTEQEAVKRWMEALLPLFEETLVWPRCASTWKEFAGNTIHDLQEKDATQLQADGHNGLSAYVKESSKIWKQPANNFELMTLADVLWPSLLYLQLHPSPGLRADCDQFVADLPGFYHADTHSISNDFRRSPVERADSWYPFENGLIKYPMIGSLAGSKEIADHFLEAFQTAEKMAQQYDYLFPIYYQVATLRAEGAGTNYAVGGLYAWAAILAHRLTGDGNYLSEARRAIQVLYKLPADRLFHEPQELAYGALAAAELGMADEARYLLYEQLRMFYWYSDPSQKTHSIRGMVQAAASILYPAFKENVEAILPWTGVMKRGIVFEGLLRFMDQQRRSNFYFFEDCSLNRKSGNSAYIPYENLGTLELAGMTGNVGKEVYGAGECIWMYLMFEALGHVGDRELMLVNLDLLDVAHSAEFPPRKLSFILYNPTAQARSAVLTIPTAKEGTMRLRKNGAESQAAFEIQERSFVGLTVEL